MNTAANLSITKSDSPDPVLAGNDLTYTITVDSAGPSDALGVSVTDGLPAGTSFVSASDGGTLAGGVVTWNLGTVQESDAPRVLTLVVKVDPGVADDTILSNSASVSSSTTDPTPGNNSATETTHVDRSADVADLKVATPDPVRAGESPLLRDHGDQQRSLGRGRCQAEGHAAGRGVQRPGVCGLRTGRAVHVPVALQQLLLWRRGVGGDAGVGLEPDGPADRGRHADVADGTTLTNKAVVSATEDDPNPANNTAFEDTQVVAEADLSITKSDSPDPVLAGNNLTYTITVDWRGPRTR